MTFAPRLLGIAATVCLLSGCSDVPSAKLIFADGRGPNDRALVAAHQKVDEQQGESTTGDPNVENNAARTEETAREREFIARVADGNQYFELPFSLIYIGPAGSTTKSTGSVGADGKSPGANVAPLATQIIDGQAWQATVLPTNSGRYYWVKANSGFWSSTTLQLGRLDNTDIVQSVSFEAVDLTQTRIQEIGAVVSAIIPLAAAAAPPPPPKKLEPLQRQLSL